MCPSLSAAILADTFISIDHHGKLLNKSQYLADLKDPSFNPAEISNSDTSIYLYGDTAIVIRAYRTRGTDGGKPFAITAASPTRGSSAMENGHALRTTKL